MPSGQPVTLDKIEEMRAAYFETQTFGYVAKKCGVSRPCVKKYVEEGDPERGIEAFKIQLRRQVRSTSRRLEKRLVYSQAESQEAVREHVRLLDEIIELAAGVLIKDIEKGRLTLTSLAKAMLARNEIVRRMAPFDEVQVESEVETVEEFEGRDDIELGFFADHSRFPTEEEHKALLHAAQLDAMDADAEHVRWGRDGGDDEYDDDE